MFNFARLKLKKQAKQIIVMSFLNRQRIKDVVAQPFVYDKEGRMRVFDAIRGLSMFLVVFGHVLGCFDLGGYDSFLGSVILTFRMPLFFFILKSATIIQYTIKGRFMSR
jgi:uncharacterized membrane protein YcfT